VKVLVVGGGKRGSALAHALEAGRHEVTVVENRQEQAERLRAQLPGCQVVWGDGTSPELLDSLGLSGFEVVAAVAGADEANLVVTSLARLEYGVPRTIASVNDPRNAWMFTPVMGVDVAVDQAELIAHLILEEMSLGDMMTLLKLRQGEYALVEERLEARSRAAGRAIGDLDLPAECAITAVIRGGRLLLPHPGVVLAAGDEVLALVPDGELSLLARLLAASA
jgi:trk system potassium uptake protein TrkA